MHRLCEIRARRAEIEAASDIDDQSAQFSRHDTELGLYWLGGFGFRGQPPGTGTVGVTPFLRLRFFTSAAS